MGKEVKRGRGYSDFFDEQGQSIAEDEVVSEFYEDSHNGRFITGDLEGTNDYTYLTDIDVEVNDGDTGDDEEYDGASGDDKEPKSKRPLIGIGVGVIALIFAFILLFNALGNRTEVANVGLEDTQAMVQALFSESGNIKRELSFDELDSAKLYVQQLEEGPGKNELQLKLSQAQKQLESQQQGQRLVTEVTKDGQPFVDINRSNLPLRVVDFPMSYDPEYAQQLSNVYNQSYDAIESAFNLEDELNKLVNSGNVTTEAIQQYKARIEQLPASQLKQRVSREYNKQMENFQTAHQESIQTAEESRREESIIAEQASREASELAKIEAEAIRKQQEQASINEAVRAQEEARIQAEVQARLEAERQESIRIDAERASIEESIQSSIQESISISIGQQVPVLDETVE